MIRRSFFAGLAAAVAGAVASPRLFAAPKTYKYKCPRCNLIQEFGSQGVRKCPNDGAIMIPQSNRSAT